MEFTRRSNGEGATPELELKFAVRPEDLPRLKRLPVLAGVSTSRRLLNGAYYDTPDLTLRRRSLALRVRREGGRFVQTLKAGGPFGTASFARDEWQWGVRTSSPDLSFPELRKQLGNVDDAVLTRVFSSRIKRSTRILHPAPDTALEVSFDQGSIETPAGEKLPVCEIELELKEGAPKALFELAHALSHVGAVRLEARSKALRGYTLVDGHRGASPPPTQRYERVELERDMPAEDALAAVVRRCLEHMLVNDPAALGGDVEGVHQMRVALRRLRATLGIFKTLVPAEQRTEAIRELKWLADTLGAARDWDIFAALAGPVQRAFPGDRDVKALLRAARRKRRAAYRAMREIMTSTRYTEIVLRMMEWVETRAWRRQEVSETSVLLLSPVGDLADGLIEKRYRKVRKLAKDFDRLDAEGRHTLRIALKKLRYGIDSFEPIYEWKPVARYVKRVSALQNDLGLLNDVATAEKLIGDLPKSTSGGDDPFRGATIMQGWLARMVSEKELKLRKKVFRFLKAKAFWKRPKKRRSDAEPAVASADEGSAP